MTVGDDAMNADVQEDGMPTNVLVNQKEHCLVGIRGTVRRKTDNWFVHCNVDTDVIVYEPDLDDLDDPDVNPAYPPQIHTIIENFCLGARRLELFAPRSQARRGWVTVGPDEMEPDGDGAGGADDVQAFDSARYGNYQESNKDEMGRYVLPLTQGEFACVRPGVYVEFRLIVIVVPAQRSTIFDLNHLFGVRGGPEGIRFIYHDDRDMWMGLVRFEGDKAGIHLISRVISNSNNSDHKGCSVPVPCRPRITPPCPLYPSPGCNRTRLPIRTR